MGTSQQSLLAGVWPPISAALRPLSADTKTSLQASSTAGKTPQVTVSHSLGLISAATKHEATKQGHGSF